VTLLILLIAIGGVLSVNEAIEVSDKIEGIDCLKGEQLNTVWVRGFMSSGMVDHNLEYNINTLTQAGIAASAYMHPCFHCGNAKKQAQDLIDKCPLKNRRFMVYVIPGQWGKDVEANRQFLRDISQTFEAAGSEAGIVTNKNLHLFPDFRDFFLKNFF